MDPANTTYILVTGANSGLGLGICQRLIDEFLASRDPSQSLHLIITTRGAKKSADTIATLQKRVSSHPSLQGASTATIAQRVTFDSESLELTSLLSVRACARRLLSSSLPRIDAIILNAGIWGVYGLDWPLTIWRVLTDWVHAVTFPDYHLSTIGAITQPQFPDLSDDAPKPLREAPPLGEVFTANVFGHYVFVHELMPLLRVPPSSTLDPAKVIWISSQDALDILSYDDIQGLRAHSGYENSKRVTDLLALTSSLPSSSKSVSDYLTPTTVRLLSNTPNDYTSTKPPAMLVCHPGMLSTNIIVLPFPLPHLWVMALWIARILGSPWHTLTAYTAAIAPVFLALISGEALSNLHSPSGPDGGGVSKWGSASVGFRGTQSVKRTLVTDWGLGGDVNEGPHWEELGFGSKVEGTVDRYSWSTGRRRDAKKPTREDIEHFQDEGAEVWRQMEVLRVEWMERCDLYEQWVREREIEKASAKA